MTWPISLARFRRRRSAQRLRRDAIFGGALFCVVFALGLWAASPARLNQPAESQASVAVASVSLRVIDGDTVENLNSGARIRIANIDTPEIHEPGCRAEAALGYRARSMTRQILSAARTLEVRSLGRQDRYGRDLALIRADGHDLGESLIAAGLARPWQGRRRPWCRADGAVRL